MNNLGFGSLKRGIMIGAIADRHSIEAIVRELKLEDRVMILKTEFDPFLTKGKFLPWNFRKINQNYQNFINRTSQLLDQKKDERTRLKAKQLVLQFARTCKIDPVLPDDSNPHDYLGTKAYKLYNQLKPLCY
ncbi:hypothetical protein HY065_00340 [Candidatus Berkelbacteria bacterium]|nr:hypothetical protein [Candidatus Berkelbacteria bacterium]